ncbi:hypothetical protein phiCbK_264 [Caulobacter phage phiCbK]|uniref:Uncharacterized protein n=5 Tax=Viruses TaxID=10239 RepID=J3SMP5_9CAUD|nr:hypothetical protein D865_gp055 [Caulobacter phage phiCbK]AFO71780.1 hypothetical protein phiCbK_264 [Caulobacter phage phiCbK]AFU86887.1 hypothetical protein CbK_gp055 [Caulobacter phage phiCbK]ARB14974.1 hypothetical protein Ccr32_gp055 [Caulobacter phage Ccr32]ARB15305.1 hypothetical protein Ccr34_gp056 [Caulobacter phage Ccr34]
MTHRPSAYLRTPPMRYPGPSGFDERLHRADGRATRLLVAPHLAWALHQLRRYGSPIDWLLPATREGLVAPGDRPFGQKTVRLKLGRRRLTRLGDYLEYMQFASDVDLATYKQWLKETPIFPVS